MSKIVCPNCNTPIDIDEVLYRQLEREAKEQLRREIEEHRQKYRAAMSELKAKEEALKEQESRLQAEARRRAEELLEKRLAEEKLALERRIKERLEAEQNALVEELRSELEQKRKEAAELAKAKLEIERLQRQKEEARLQAQLEAEKRLSEALEAERKKLKEQLELQEEALRKRLAQETELKLKEKEVQLEQLKRQLEEARQKAEQGSQQLQGEAQELLIEEWLAARFPQDSIEEIKKGARGGDCIQIVNDPALPKCGAIYYESKRTKEFQKSWIEKLKKDMRERGADVGVLVTQAMPKDMERMGLVDGVWVCSFEEFKALSTILREYIVRLAYAKRSQENMQDKMGLLYRYLTSNEFRLHIEAIVESFVQMQEDLDKERRAMQRLWKQREKQIERVLESTTAMYGAIRGIAGSTIPHIQALELPFAEDGE